MAMLRDRKKGWTKTGFDCFISRGDCANCEINQFLGLDSRNGCKQIESNQMLIDASIPIPENFFQVDSMLDQDKPERAEFQSVRKIGLSNIGKSNHDPERLRAGWRLKWRIMDILKESSPISTQDIAKRLDDEKFLGQHWDGLAIRRHLVTLHSHGIVQGMRGYQFDLPIYLLDVERFEHEFKDYTKGRHKWAGSIKA